MLTMCKVTGGYCSNCNKGEYCGFRFETKLYSESLDYPFEIKKNQYYKHFKGKTVRIIAVAQFTEDPSQKFVVYEEWKSGKQWARPLEMFCSKVDKEKYPDAEQKWRFELIR